MGSLPSQASPCLQTSSNSWIFRRQLFRRAAFYGPVASQTHHSPTSKVPPGYPRAGALWPGSRVAALGLGWRPAAALARKGESAESSPPSCSGGFQAHSFARGLLCPHQGQRRLLDCLLWPTSELQGEPGGCSRASRGPPPSRAQPDPGAADPRPKSSHPGNGGGAGSMQQGCPGRGGLSRTVRGQPSAAASAKCPALHCPADLAHCSPSILAL